MIYLLLLNFAELILGSRDGALFSFELSGFRVTLRMLLFVLTLVVWLGFRRKIWPLQRSIMPWIALWLLVLFGALSGLFWSNSPQAIFNDANAYAFTLLILPVLTLSVEEIRKLRALLERFLPTLGLIISVVTILLAIAFSYGFSEHGDWLYKLIRDLRLGEITPVTHGFTRIFIQSQLWLLPIWFMMSLRPWTTKNFAITTVITAALMLSLSRSFWIGWVAGAILLLVRARFHGLVYGTAKKIGASLLVSVALTTILFPQFPRAILARGSSGEPAVSTRQAQLIPIWSHMVEDGITFVFGSGFGTILSYDSFDPRSHGIIRTSAFEWGYLDQWIDMGLIGLLVFFYLLVSLIKKTWHEPWITASLIAVAVTHSTSPYLNHPLGLGILLLAALYVPKSSANSG